MVAVSIYIGTAVTLNNGTQGLLVGGGECPAPHTIAACNVGTTITLINGTQRLLGG
jgi:hypothetical protein